jgi:uncharacterized protein (DUF305 family)
MITAATLRRTCRCAAGAAAVLAAAASGATGSVATRTALPGLAAAAIGLAVITAASAQESGDVLYTPDDLMYLTHMIVHHEQALELTTLVPARAQHAELIKFARYLDGAQRAEIDQMKGLLDLAAKRGLEIPHHDMTGDPPMAGMLSKAQMAALAAASGPEFEKLWLQGMIYHHQGALDMARAEQRREFESGRRPYGIDTLADAIIDVQRGEITKMNMWLKEWHLIP